MKTTIPLLLGSGKLYRHLSHLLTREGRAFLHFESPRALNATFYSKLSQADWVWLLVSDTAIGPLTDEIRARAPTARLVHASGAASIPGVLTAHPLYTFGPELYPIDAYRNFSFAFIEEELRDAPDFAGGFKQLFSNPTFRIPASSRGLYHALASVTANFPQLLWSWCQDEAARAGLDYRTFHPLLERAASNYASLGPTALTGPLVRGDATTLARHESALSTTGLLPLYQEFVRQFRQRKDAP